MNHIDALTALADKVRKHSSQIQTEEATKNAFVMPFLGQVLGYDVFDPAEVVPEYVCDIGTKRGEKIDYAVLMGGQVQMLFECKKVTEPLRLNHASQLFRYFHVTNARIGVLTNGREYQFFTDLDAPNKMDEKPFLVLDLLDIDEHAAPTLVKLTKQAFDLESVLSAAGELKHMSLLKRVLAAELSSPSDELLRFFVGRVYDGTITAKVREQFAPLLVKAIAQHMTESINDRLRAAIAPAVQPIDAIAETEVNASGDERGEVVTTELEKEGFFIVKSIVRSVIDPARITMRDNQTYLAVLVDDNNRKPLCRLHLNRATLYLGLLDADKRETRHVINTIDCIYDHADALATQARAYC